MLGNVSRVVGAFAIVATAAVAYAAPPWNFSAQDAAKMKNPVAAKDRAASAARGKGTYQAMCATCHGASGKGDGPVGGALGTSVGDFTTQDFAKQLDGTVYMKLAVGRGAMPGYKGSMKPAQLWDLVNYIRSLNPNKKSK